MSKSFSKNKIKLKGNKMQFQYFALIAIIILQGVNSRFINTDVAGSSKYTPTALAGH